MNGKGSKQRPTNGKKYRKNYDKAFKKKLKKVSKEVDVNIDPDTGTISIGNKDGSSKRVEHQIVVKREYVDQNGIEMCIVNIDGGLTNKTMTKKMLHALEHGIVNEEHPDAIKARKAVDEFDNQMKELKQKDSK